MGTGPQGTSGEVRWTHCARVPRRVRFPVRSAGDSGARAEHEVTPSPPSTAVYWPGTRLGSWTGERGFQVGQFPGNRLGRESERAVVLAKTSDGATECWDPWGPQQGDPGVGDSETSSGHLGGAGGGCWLPWSRFGKWKGCSGTSDCAGRWGSRKGDVSGFPFSPSNGRSPALPQHLEKL